MLGLGFRIVDGELEMKRLDESFTSKNHRHELVKRTGDIAIYKRWSIATEPNQTPHYEVVKINTSKETETIINGRIVRFESRENYPTENNWGTMGWTYHSFSSAMAKFNVLTKNRPEVRAENEMAKNGH